MNPFKGRHFQRDIIQWAARWYCKYGISYRELQVLPTVQNWVFRNLGGRKLMKLFS